MILPPLTEEEIEKFDLLLSYLKENKTGFVNIYDDFCEPKWGDNRQLYLCFATHLKINSLTIVQTHKGEEYIWGQMISQRGLALESFKNEYRKQNEIAKKEHADKAWDRYAKRFDGLSKPVLLIVAIGGFVFGGYQFNIARKNETSKVEKQRTIDSLLKVLSLKKMAN